ncbi:MAG: hypothetical protein FWC72_07215 [Oscillospiraceae bacterium]|nr:hypothetical protein [Oscillospiraceae bacterium]
MPFGSYRSVHLEVNIVNRLRVIEVFHGETQPGDLIEVSQSRFGERYNWHQFRRGDDLVLFLRTFDDFPAVLLTPYYSVYRWPSLESAHPWNPITLTIEELNRISEEN